MNRAAKLAAVCASAALWLGCSRQTDPKADMAALEQSFAGTTQSNPVPGEAGAYVQAALAAARQDDNAGAVMALQAAQLSTHVTADQLKAVHAAMESITESLVERAARGDQKAQAALAAIERTRSQ